MSQPQYVVNATPSAIVDDVMMAGLMTTSYGPYEMVDGSIAELEVICGKHPECTVTWHVLNTL